ncbi:MAG: insulinase family protein, partial [Alphaproteobacteria bacterium]|nr:insulinase family protein [Alphaproteobacteria bacterium]
MFGRILYFPHVEFRMPKVFLALVCALFFVAAPSSAAVFYPETYTLANGLQIVIVSNRLSPAVSQMVWYKAGAVDEEPLGAGLAHYLEHLMFRGTEKIPAGAFSALIAAQGGEDNAFTSHDATAYYETVAADRLPFIMQMEADRMENLRLTSVTAAAELDVVRAEREERTGNKPQGQFAEKMQAALFPDHPYGIPVIGLREEMAKMTPAQAENFYRSHYAPNNAVVVVSGPVDAAEVLRFAEATFGRVPRRALAPRRVFPQPTVPREKRVTMIDARVQQPHVEIHVVAPSYATQKKNEAYALEVLSEVLTGGEVGVLYQELVVEKNLASGVDVSYDPQTRGPAEFSLIAVPQAGRDVHDVEAALRAAVAKWARRGLDKTKVKKAQERLQREAIFARDSLMAPGQVLGAAL